MSGYKNLTDEEMLMRHFDSAKSELNGLSSSLQNAYVKVSMLDDNDLLKLGYKLAHPITCEDTFNKVMNSSAFVGYVSSYEREVENNA